MLSKGIQGRWSNPLKFFLERSMYSIPALIRVASLPLPRPVPEGPTFAKIAEYAPQFVGSTTIRACPKTMRDTYKQRPSPCPNIFCNSSNTFPKGPPISRRPKKKKLHSSAVIAAKMPDRAVDGAGQGQIIHYKLRESCKLVLQPGDITKWHVNGEADAIVNAANERMLGGGGVDGAIHRVAGPELLKACRAVPEVEPGIRCPTGSAKITKGFNLHSAYIIHTVGPVYESKEDSARALSSAYKSSIALAKENHIKYVAFPAISCGVYGYPFEEATDVALSTLQKHADGLEEVHFVLFDPATWKAWLEKADNMFEKQEKPVEL